MGSRIKKLREKKGLTQKTVADFIGVSPSTYRDWEYGKSIQGEPYLALAEIFEISIGELLTGKASSRVELFQALAKIEEDVKSLRKIAGAM